MEKIDQIDNNDQRQKPREFVEPGSTVHIQCDGREIIGTLENKNDGGLGLQVSEAFRQALPDNKEIAVTYSMPYGLVSRRVQVCWVGGEESGKLKLGTAFLDNDEGFQTDYQKLWKQFSDADKLETAAQTWLSLQCAMLSGVIRGVLVIGKPDSGSYSPISFWPEEHRGSLGLTEVVDLVLHERRGVLRDQGQFDAELNLHVCHMGHPLMLGPQLYGAVAVEIAVRADQFMRSSMRQLQWGAAWLELFLRREEGKKFSPENQQLVTVLDLIAVGLEQQNFQEAATAVATELAALLKCERVSIGFREGKYIRVRAVSHSVQFAKKSNLIANIGLAMDESMEQMDTLVYPIMNEQVVQILGCHEKMVREQGSGGICTIPFCSHNSVFGALTLEKPPGQVFDRQTVELCETIGSLIGPILENKRREDLWLVQKAWFALKEHYKNLVGPTHGALKLGFGLIIFLMLFCLFAKGEYRIAAETHLEGAIQRVIAAPFDGYISETHVRPGDIVQKGMSLAKLDDTDLLLEKVKLESQREQYLKEYRDALGQADRSKVSVLKAQLGQAEAQLSLIESQLVRVDVKAPFSGVIVSGDLSQKLGSPSQRGDVLFEIAPLDVYRVVLEVDERDIAYVGVRQPGQLVLTGHAEEVIPFVVSKITPVSEAKEGRNYFRVEASLERSLDFLRPGMKGVGKIQAGERRLIWIWSKNLVDWLRLTLWTWWPNGL